MHIHDGLTQAVTSAILELQILRHQIEIDPRHRRGRLGEVEDALREDLREIRELLFELQEGRRTSEQPFASFVADLVERWKLPARVRSRATSTRSRDGACWRRRTAIIAEALANAAKHSGSKDVTVRVRAGDGRCRSKSKIGAAGSRPRRMTTRISECACFGRGPKQLGGSVDIGSTPGERRPVVAALPVGGRGETR